jgi:glycosyltransferase involved in cell wall biosynthesis
MAKTRVLAWGDYCAATGFGTVMSNIMRHLDATDNYDLEIIGINYDGGPYDPEKWPGKVWPAISALRMQGPYQDYHGRQVFLDHLAAKEYDVVFIIQDTFIVLPIVEKILEIQRAKEVPFSTIFYYPFDCAPPQEWVTHCVAQFDFPVAYTDYAREESRKYIGEMANNHGVVFHGTNTKDFYPLDNKQELKKLIFPVYEDKFIVTNINRNQSRKDLARSFMILKELRDRGHDDIVFYMHTQESDFGGSILKIASNFGLVPGVDWTLPNPQQFSAHSGFPIEMVNQIYNASDCFLTTTHGEGWGLSITEAMAAKLPVVAPDNTSVPEILGDDRGWRIPSGATPSMWVHKDNDNDRIRPLMDVEKAADAILEIKNNAEEAQRRAENALTWIQENTWDIVCQDWVKIFNKAGNKSRTVRLLKSGIK